MSDTDHDVLAAVFTARVSLCKKSEQEAASEAIAERLRCLEWMKSNKVGERSFLWFCDEFDLDPDAVRRAIQEGK
jgi:hypothetical protein